MEEEKLFELLTSVKNMVKTDPAQARTALSSHPNLAYALMKEMVTLDVVDPEVLTRTLQAATGVQPPQPPPQQTYAPPQQPTQTYPPPTQAYPPHSQGYPPSNPSYPTYPPSYGAPQYPSQPAVAPVPTPVPAPAPAPAPSVPPHMYQARQQQQQQPTPPPQARGPPPAAAAPAPGLAPEQQAMIQRLASLTPDQIALLPPADRAALMELRRQLGLS